MNNLALKEIIKKLEEELTHLKSQSLDIIVFTEKAAGTCWFALLEIRQLIIKNGFQNHEEEIYFFKQIKPEVFSKYLYYYKLFEIERDQFNYRVGGIKSIYLSFIHGNRNTTRSLTARRVI